MLSSPPNTATLPGLYEQDVDYYFGQVMSCLTDAVRAEPDATAIVLTTQMHGFVLTDREMRTRSRYISWQDGASLLPDSNGVTAVDALRSFLPEDALTRHGVLMKPNLAMCNLYARIRDGFAIPPDTLIHTLGGYVLGRLCGRHICHDTNAAPLGLYNMLEHRMDSALSEMVLGSNLVLPEVVHKYIPIGECCIAGCNMTLYPDVGDHQACVLGALDGCMDCLCINVGTAGLISTVSRKFNTGACETRPFFDGLFLPTVSGLPGGRHLDVVFRFIRRMLDGFKTDVPDEVIWNKLIFCDAETELESGVDYFSSNGYVRGIGVETVFDDCVASIYKAMGSAYGEAARIITGENVYENIAFIGGAVEKNPSLRKGILRELGNRNASVICDSILRGAMHLARSTQTGVGTCGTEEIK
jgi:hypothetical protein